MRRQTGFFLGADTAVSSTGTALPVMAGLVPAIHDLTTPPKEFVDAGHKAGHDAVEAVSIHPDGFRNQRTTQT